MIIGVHYVRKQRRKHESVHKTTNGKSTIKVETEQTRIGKRNSAHEQNLRRTKHTRKKNLSLPAWVQHRVWRADAVCAWSTAQRKEFVDEFCACHRMPACPPGRTTCCSSMPWKVHVLARVPHCKPYVCLCFTRVFLVDFACVTQVCQGPREQEEERATTERR